MIKHLIRFKKNGHVLQGVAYHKIKKEFVPCELSFESHDEALTWLENTFRFGIEHGPTKDYRLENFSIEEFTL